MPAVPENYVYACRTSELPARGKRLIPLGGTPVLIIVCEEGLFAVEDRDPQTGQSMARGKVLACMITSPNTGAHYDLMTGQYAGGGEALFQSHWLPVFPLCVIDEAVYVHLPVAE